MTTCLFIGILMPAIRAIYFSLEPKAKRETVLIRTEKGRESVQKFSARIKPLGEAKLAVVEAMRSALPLLVARIRCANDVDDAAPPHHLAVLANLFDRRTNFHFLLPMPLRLAFFIRPSY
jgi:hypothetical protein